MAHRGAQASGHRVLDFVPSMVDDDGVSAAMKLVPFGIVLLLGVEFPMPRHL